MVDVEPFLPLPVWAKRGVKAEAESLAAFTGAGRVELTYKG